jgi:DNA-binding response OmpR family regulator
MKLDNFFKKKLIGELKVTFNILLVDDSPTIQKVIKMTSAQEPFEFTDCRSEKEIYQILNSKKKRYDLVLLDFNISEEISGYEVAKKIYQMQPGQKIIMMYGTFDTIDEGNLIKSKVRGKIVKPFESVKFLNLCHSVLGEPTPQISALPIEEDNTKLDSSISSKLSEFGSSNIGSEERKLEISKDVIKNSHFMAKAETEEEPWKIENLAEKNSKESVHYPSNEDLDYPDLDGNLNLNLNTKPFENQVSTARTPKFDTFDELKIELDEPVDTLNSNNAKEELKDIDQLLREEVKNKNFWEPDQNESLTEEIREELNNVSRINQENNKVNLTDTSKLSDNSELIQKIVDEFSKEMLDQLKPIITETLMNYCSKTIEKIGWEILPDLAENIIKKELKKLGEETKEEYKKTQNY